MIHKTFTSRSLTTALAAGGLLAFAAGGQVMAADSATSDVALEVMQSISVANDQAMDFGTAYTNDAGTQLAHQTPASFTVTGTDGVNYDVTGDTSATISNGTTDVTVDLTLPTGGTLTSGSDSFDVAGSIASLPSEAGTYSGSFSVTVSYAN